MTTIHIDKKTGALIGGALVIGLLVGGALGAGHERGGYEDRDEHMGGNVQMHGAMQGMTMGLTGLQGDAFDKAFLAEMIVHHQGAVAMAQQALTSSKHQEIKDMAQKIIDAQNAEITQMQAWQTSWYPAQ
jgi:uncharacterized protein (DUF305 family)